MSEATTSFSKSEAGPSLALIKYFGKRDDALNLPATPSLGLTVRGFGSEAVVEALPAGAPETLELDGRPASAAALARAVRLWDATRVAGAALVSFRARVTNRLPAAAGLASSSSSFAALARASVKAAGLTLPTVDVAALARLGSGSAARACFDGWSALETDGRAFAVDPDVAVELVAAIVEPGPKSVPSAVAMERARATSPLYAEWLELGRFHFDAALAALAERDLGHLFALAEANSRLMHEVLAACVPSLDYATPRTREALAAIERLRGDWAFPLAVSRDAGPNPFVAVEAGQGARVADALARALPGADVRVLCARSR
jgi:diphosphomevalonate decarboxylase